MDEDKADVASKMVLIFEIHNDFVHERFCKFTPEIEANRNLSFCLDEFG